jgi:hypothetical protein
MCETSGVSRSRPIVPAMVSMLFVTRRGRVEGRCDGVMCVGESSNNVDYHSHLTT